jgi:hypothetical protein
MTVPRRLFMTSGMAGVLLAGVALDWRTYHGGLLGAEDYHRHVRAAVEAIPFRAGDWVSQDTPVLPAAQELLRPNVILSRRYQNFTSGLEASFLLVQCTDARDLLGHYPPVCYKANGYELLDAEPATYDHNSLHLEGKLYTFSSANLASHDQIKVFDFMILPNGLTAPDMAGVNAIARDRHIRHFGAAQVQVVTDAAMSDREREAVTRALLESARPAINAIREGVTP